MSSENGYHHFFQGGNRVLRYSCGAAGRVSLRRAGASSGRLRRRTPHRPAAPQAATPPAAAAAQENKHLKQLAYITTSNPRTIILPNQKNHPSGRCHPS